MTADPMAQGDRTLASVIVVHAWRLGEQATHLKLHPLDFSLDRGDQAQLKNQHKSISPPCHQLRAIQCGLTERMLKRTEEPYSRSIPLKQPDSSTHPPVHSNSVGMSNALAHAPIPAYCLSLWTESQWRSSFRVGLLTLPSPHTA